MVETGDRRIETLTKVEFVTETVFEWKDYRAVIKVYSLILSIGVRLVSVFTVDSSM